MRTNLNLSLLLKVTLLGVYLLASSNPAMAQFDKYKSKTKYKTKKAKPASSLLNPTNGSNDVFGRGTGISNANLPKKDKKYVNLNPETAFGPEVVTSFDFPNTSLVDLTKHMQKLTGINLIIDKELKGKVSIMAPTAITVGDAWKAYLTALNMSGYTLVKAGSFYKIVQVRDIRYTPTKIYTGNYTPNTENYAMRIIPLKNINSTEVTRSFRPFMSRYGRIIEIKQTNTIIVQDTGSNINRLVRLIKFIDVPGHEETLQIIPVKNSSAQEIAKLLDQIIKGGSKSKFRASSKKAAKSNFGKLIAEPRTNAIIAMANADGAKQLRALIKKLDVKVVSSTSGQIHVYYLNHGDAESLAKTLSTLVSSSQAKKSSSRFSKRASAAESSSLFSANVKLTADKDNNAIVVTASPTDYLTIKEVIKKLDIPRAQVFVEAMIMETNVTKEHSFGINLIGAHGSGKLDRFGSLNDSSGLVNLLTDNIVNLGGLFLGGGIGKKVTTTVGGEEVQLRTVNGLITAIAANSNTNILATPQLLARDNEEAIFEVGEKVPVSEKTNAANGSSSTAIKYQPVTLSLKITPQINKVTRMVKLKIDQQIDDFSTRKLADNVASEGTAITTRKTVTTVNVRDRDTIAMGGLMRDKETHGVSKVPLLGDIPVLGWLFKSTTKTMSKVNLLFFLTPKIMDDDSVEMARTMKDTLNRRSSHLKNVVGEDDPFGSTVKGLYQKAKMQEKGPLYDVEKAKKLKKQNEAPGIGSLLNEDTVTTPNYKDIAQKVSRKAAANKRN